MSYSFKRKRSWKEILAIKKYYACQKKESLMKKRYDNVTVTIEETSRSRYEDLADQLLSCTDQELRNVFNIIKSIDKVKLVRIAQALHGRLYDCMRNC